MLRTRREREEFDRATRTGYLVTRSRKPDILSAWWHWCERKQKPFVVVRIAAKYASVRLDMATTKHNLTEDTARRMQRLLAGYSAQTADIIAGTVSCESDKVNKLSAESVARDLLEWAIDDMSRSEGA